MALQENETAMEGSQDAGAKPSEEQHHEHNPDEDDPTKDTWVGRLWRRWRRFKEEMIILRMINALRQNWVTWFVLFFSQGIKGLVNQVEQPFARSLIACDTPVDPDIYTGSRWCGDRLKVIEDGMYLSAVGQGQESCAMLCSLTFVIILTGVWGPKSSLILGLTGVTISVLLFVVAATSPELGRSLFAMGQGLQGLYPIEYLIGILMLHLGALPDSDGEANFQVMSYMFIVSNSFWNTFLGNGVAMFELTDYGRVWTAILVINIFVLCLTGLCFPPMKPIGADPRYADKSPLMKVVHEVLSYKDLIYDWRARRYMVKMFCENLAMTFNFVMIGAQMMAWHGYSQSSMTLLGLIPQMCELFTMPYYRSLLIRRYGFFNTYVSTVYFYIFGNAVIQFSLMYTANGHLAFTVCRTLLAGFMPLKGMVDSRFTDPEQMQRFQSAQWVMGYFLGMWSGPFFASQFSASAQTMWERSTPFMIYLGLLAFQYWSVFHLIYDMDGVHGFGVTVRQLDQIEKLGKELWQIIATDNGTAEWPMITSEKWCKYDMHIILGKMPDDVGAPIMGFAHWEAILGSMNGTSQSGNDLIGKLQILIPEAKKKQEFQIETVQEQYFPELEGYWYPVRGDEWMRPHEAFHPNSKEMWGSNGTAHFENGDWEHGFLKVVHKSEQGYAVFYKLLSGPTAGMEGVIFMKLQPDGVRRFELPARYLRKAQPNELHHYLPEAAHHHHGAEGERQEDRQAAGSQTQAVAEGESNAPAPGADAPAAADAGAPAPGADAPAPEGKKDA